MLKVTDEYDFDTLYNNSWGKAVSVLLEIKEADKSEELMSYLEDCFPEGVNSIELNDFIAYDWEDIYRQIGMPNYDDDEEEEEEE